MNYLGYIINVRGRRWGDNLAEADISAQDGEYISIVDTDTVAAEAAAREIARYARLHRTTLADSARQVLY